MVGGVRGLLSSDGNRCKGLLESEIGIERRKIWIGQRKVGIGLRNTRRGSEKLGLYGGKSASDNGTTAVESENPGLDNGKSALDNGTPVMESGKSGLESGTSELESGAKDSESVIEMEITKQVGNSAGQGKASVKATAANGTETESRNGHTIAGENPGGNGNNGTKHESSVNTSCDFKMEKPKMPRFAGDVRDYAIFRSDFKHAVDSRYSKRDGISLLRTSLQGRPLNLIKGIGTDYDAAWSYLDSVYGDPRFVADTITRTSLSSDLFAMEKMLGFVIWCTLCKEVLPH